MSDPHPEPTDLSIENAILHRRVAELEEERRDLLARRQTVDPARDAPRTDAGGGDVQVLAELAAQLQDVANEERAYELLGHGLRQLLGDDAIINVSAFEPSMKGYFSKALLGLGWYVDALTRLLGKRPEFLTGDYTESVKGAMASGRLTRIEGGVAELAGDSLPPAICHAAAALIGIKEVYVVGFHRGLVVGGVSILPRRPGAVLPAALIEAMTTLCAIAISRLRTLRVSEEKYRRLVDNISDIIHSISADGVIRFVSPACMSTLGHPVAGMEGRSIGEFIHPDDLPACLEYLENVAQEEEPSLGPEYRVRHADGSWRWHALSASPVRDTAGAVIQFDCIARDITERKWAEEVLREREARFRAITDSARDAIIMMRPDGAVSFWNPAATDIFGYGVDEVLGRDLHQLLSPERLLSRQQAAFASFVKTGVGAAVNKTMELPGRRKDGSEVFVELSLTTLKQPDGWHSVGIVRDISERLSTQKKLLEKTNELDGFFTAALDLLCVADTNGMFRRLNPQWERVLGYPLNELEGRSFLDFVHPDDMQSTLDAIATLSDSKEVINHVNRLRCRDGSYRYIEWRSFPRDNIVYAAARDITAHRQSEAALKESEERYRLLHNISADVILLHHMEGGRPGRIIEANDATCRRYGYTRDELLQMTPLDLDAPEGLAMMPQGVQRLQTERQATWEGMHRTKDGRKVPVEIVAVLFEHKGEPLVLSASRDITERRRAEEEREKLQTQLLQAQKMESVGRLAGGVAHDFNNMLGVILGHSELALEIVDPALPLHADLQEIHKAASRSAELTRQLLAFARKQTIAPRVLDLNEAVSGMLSMLRRLIGEDIQLAWFPGADTGLVTIDPSQADQILANLCVNARDAITGPGKLTIETGNVSIDDEYCALHPGAVAGDYVMLAVSDDGCGMDAETQSHLFEPFFTTKDRGKGTGLGLATVFGIVQQNSGFINVYSEPGHGTTFKIYLPRTRSEPTAAGQAASSMLGSETILLVEDEPAIRRVTLRMLRRLGYVVLTAGSPREAIRLAQEHPGRIDLLLSDVIMPEMNGRELAKNLLSIKPGLKHLYMSGYTANVIAHHGVLDDGVHFVQKPFTSDVLAAKLREVLEGR